MVSANRPDQIGANDVVNAGLDEGLAVPVSLARRGGLPMAGWVRWSRMTCGTVYSTDCCRRCAMARARLVARCGLRLSARWRASMLTYATL
jgi:hypothetical protein